MRPRFSLKWLLLSFAILAACLYAFYVYPTTKAERLVAAINRAEVHPYDVVPQPDTIYFSNPEIRRKIGARKTAAAQLLPRTWDDFWHARRRLGVTVTWSIESPSFELQHQVQLTSSPTGFQLYNWNEREVPLQPPVTNSASP